MITYNFTIEETNLYEEFRKLQYQCFVKEQAWDIPSDHDTSMTLKSEHDHLANYTLIELDGEFIGCGRTFIYSEDFQPYNYLYKNVLENIFFQKNIGQIAVINGACFKTSFREMKRGIKDEERRTRLLRRLTLELLTNLYDKNVELALFSTGIQEVAFSCHKLAFKLIMEPIPFYGPIPTICSMAGHVKSILKQNIESYENLIPDQKGNIFKKELDKVNSLEESDDPALIYSKKLTPIKMIIKH